MFTFYSFYITWNTIISIGSMISFGLIIHNVINTSNSPPDNCNVSLSDITFSLIHLMYFSLVIRIIFGIIQIFTYCATYNNENSGCRKFINVIMSIFYIISIVGLVLIAKQFTNNNGCYNYYKDNLKYVLFSYISIDIIYMIEVVAFVIGIIAYVCTCKHRESYEYDKYQRF